MYSCLTSRINAGGVLGVPPARALRRSLLGALSLLLLLMGTAIGLQARSTAGPATRGIAISGGSAPSNGGGARSSGGASRDVGVGASRDKIRWARRAADTGPRDGASSSGRPSSGGGASSGGGPSGGGPSVGKRPWWPLANLESMPTDFFTQYDMESFYAR